MEINYYIWLVPWLLTSLSRTKLYMPFSPDGSGILEAQRRDIANSRNFETKEALRIRFK